MVVLWDLLAPFNFACLGAFIHQALKFCHAKDIVSLTKILVWLAMIALN